MIPPLAGASHLSSIEQGILATGYYVSLESHVDIGSAFAESLGLVHWRCAMILIHNFPVTKKQGDIDGPDRCQDRTRGKEAHARSAEGSFERIVVGTVLCVRHRARGQTNSASGRSTNSHPFAGIWQVWLAANHNLPDSRAVAAKPNDPNIMDTLAEAYFVNGRIDDAIATEQKALTLAPNRDDLQKQLEKFKQAKKPKQPQKK